MEKQEGTRILQIEDFWPPKDLLAKSMYRLDTVKGGVAGVLNLLRTQNVPEIPVPHSEKILTPTLAEAKEYVQSEIDFVKKRYPDGYRYNSTAERFRRNAKILEKALQNKDGLPLIRYLLDESLRESKIGKRTAERVQKMTQKERDGLEKSRLQAIADLEHFRKTKDPDDLGMAPEFFESGMESAARSQLFLAYAIIFAKET